MPPKRPSSGAYQQRTPPQRSVRSRVTPTSHSPTKTPNLCHIPPDSHEWTDPRTTCLSLGLEPSDAISRWRRRRADLRCSRRRTRPAAWRCSHRRTKPAGQRWPAGQRCTRKQKIRCRHRRKRKDRRACILTTNRT